MTILGKLVASQQDYDGYITYVFECLDGRFNGSKYLMCTMFRNWDHREVKIGEKGFVEVQEIKAGIDKWFDGITFIPYKYSNIQFIKFLPLKDEINCDFIMN